MTLEEGTSNRNKKSGKKGHVSVAQRLQTNAQLSPRSQDGTDDKDGDPKQRIVLGKYDRATIRIIAQFLDNAGLQNSVEALVQETGFKIETSAGARIRANIIKGNYDAAVSVLKQARDLPEDTAQNAGFIIQCFKLADLVRKGRYFDALFTMKTMAPTINPEQTKHLEYFNSFVKNVMLGENDYQHLEASNVRESQLGFLEELLPTDFILPQNRLKSILGKVHGPPTDEKSIKLLRDELPTASQGALYKETQQIIDASNIPIYIVKFSRNGKMLATGGRIAQVTVWDVRNGQLKKRGDMLSNAEGDIGYMEFCQKNKFLLACGGVASKYHVSYFILYVHIYDLNTRQLCRTLKVNNTRDDLSDIASFFTCASFMTSQLADRTRVVAGNEMGTLKIFEISLNEQPGASRQIMGFRVRCVYGMKDGDSFLTVDSMNRVRLYSISSDNQEGTTVCKEDVTILNMTVHPSEKLVLTTTDVNLRLWDIRNRNLVRVFTGACQREEFIKYQIHSSFGGCHQQFIATGSIGKETEASLTENNRDKRKNGRVVIWSVEESRPKFEFAGHKGHVNGVTWNPTNPAMLVSCGDDSTIRVWNLKKSVTSEYSHIVPRRITREEKRNALLEMPSTSNSRNHEPLRQEIMKSLRDQVKRMSTNTEFETDLKMEQEWIRMKGKPKFALDREKTGRRM
ncbi:hypothetical protein B9Z55_018516 [Caenorhabditis nigoni]|uniref:CTLH domain-containing protein n=1 Tax=Caenorhabditis nigoni TaxID=1611254 RepID=A0A2G5TEA8_9PELO|nr:hypothetical protein B9Z55_018516 [Caenorhabditis nigoni]